MPAGVHDDGDVREYFASRIVEHCELWVAEEAGVLLGILVLAASGSTSSTSTPT